MVLTRGSGRAARGRRRGESGPRGAGERRAEHWAGAWEQAREEGETGCAGEGKKEKGWAASWAAWAEVGRSGLGWLG